MTLRLDFISAADAAKAIARWYYRPGLPVGKLVRFGAWEEGKFIGVVMFGMGACDSLGTRFGLTCFQICEMVRVAFGDHSTHISRIVAIALRLLKRQSPGLRAVVSYCDPDAGHVGTIYQAMGWIYTGTGQKQKMFRHKLTGELLHSRAVSANGLRKKIGGLQRVVRNDECVEINVSGKHRYFWPYDDAIRAKIETEKQPYPKRAGDVMLHASPSSGEEAVQIRPRRSTLNTT